MKKIEILLLSLILLGAFLVRLYKFDLPIADWHSWRQADTSAVSRNFVKFGFDVLHPRFDDLSNGVSLIDNPMGYRFVEFPIYNVLQTGLFLLFPKFTIEEWGRLVTIFSCLTSIIFLYLLVQKYVNSRVGLLAAFFFAFIPYNIYYGRTILPDQLMVASLLGGIYFFSDWIELSEGRGQKAEVRKYIYFVLAVLFITGAFLLKPYALFFTLPMIYLAWQRFGLNLFKKWQLWVFLLLTTLPLAAWHTWMYQYPMGIPRNDWLFNGNGIRFKGAFFNWLFAERIGKMILGFWGLPFVVLGILAKLNNKKNWFFLSFLFSSLIYMTVMATGNIQHDYYQILIIPTLAIFWALGVDFILRNSGGLLNKLTSYIVIFVSIAFMFGFGWFVVRDFYSIHHPEIIEAGHAVDTLTPKNAKVIAVYGGDTTFLYHTNRQGWPVFERSFKDFKKAGATHIAFVNPGKDELNLERLFKAVIIAPTYAIFDMTKPTEEGLKEQKNN